MGGGRQDKSNAFNHKPLPVNSCSVPAVMCIVYTSDPIRVYIYKASIYLCYDTIQLCPSYAIIQVNTESAIDRH